MLTFPAPSTLNGKLLAQQLTDAGLPTSEWGVALVGDRIELADLDESDRAAAQAVVDAHPPTAQAALDKAAGERTNESTIRDRAGQAIATNTTDIATNDNFLTITNPTTAQILAQVRELTRHDSRRAKQVNALIRLVLNRFDGTD